ncbi:DUF6088 family protein [Achromobacter spanius]|jgi:hypothetical protein|uniref:DUF6088 family protein n=1 Tax=Achromobacter spanius TaxID=217203 RepID=UPI0009F99449|nr:DUF6088 family protein [Achromobacter spanius]MCW3156353.1 DUF6088 family protein [Achromobacter spanius]
MRLEDRMARSITLRPGVVVLRSDFAHMASDSQVGRVLASFVKKGRLVRVSHGVFAKTRINRFTGERTPAGTLESISAELFQKLGIQVEPSSLVAEYNRGTSTQLPMGATVRTGNKRISRNITVGNRSIRFE